MQRNPPLPSLNALEAAHSSLQQMLAQAEVISLDLKVTDSTPSRLLHQTLQDAQAAQAALAQHTIALRQAIQSPSDPLIPSAISPTATSSEPSPQNSETLFQQLFEASTDAILLLKDGRFIDCNPATVTMMRCQSKTEFLSLHPSQLSPEFQPDGRPSFEKANQMMALALAQGSHRFEWMHQRLNGELFWVEVLLTRIDMNERQILHTTWRDINDRKQLEAERQKAEATLKETNSFLTSVLEAIPGFFFAKDQEGKYIALNSNLADFYQHSIAEVIGKTEFDFFPPEVATSFMNNDREVMAQEVLRRFEEVVPISSSKSATYLSTKAPLYRATGDVVGVIGLAQDISDLKTMEVSLRQSEQRFRDVTEAAGEYIWEITADGLYTFATERAKAVKGYSPDQLLGHTPFEFIPPEDIPQVEAILQTAAQQKSVFQLEHRNVLPSGEVAWEAVSGVPILDEQGEIIGFRGTGLSITERKLAEIKLAESEAKFRRLVENANDLLYEIDPNGQFTYLSPQLTKVWGYAVDDFLGQTFAPLVHPDDLPKILDSNQKLFATGKRQTGLELRVRHQDGTWIWTTCNNSPIQDAENQVIGFQGIARDISDRKAFEETQSRLTAILDATSDFVGISNMHGEQLYMNPAGYAMFEIPLGEDILGQSLAERLPDWAKATVLEEGIPTAIREGVWQGEAGIVTYTGREIPVSQVIIAHKGPDGTPEYLSTIGRDITAQKQVEAALQQKAKELEQTLQALQQTQLQMIQSEKMSSLGQLVAGIAHEINNPVNFIYGNISPTHQYAQDLLDLVELYQQEYPIPSPLIQDEIEEMDLEFLREDLPKTLSSMKMGADRIRQIVGSLRNFSRLDEADCKEVDIHTGIDSTLVILEHRIKATSRRPAIQVIKQYGDLPWVECYPGQLNQVIMNILANALDALEEKDSHRPIAGIKQSPSMITIQTQFVEPGQVTIQISDNGPGISADAQQRIFDPFFTTKTVGKGTGIGMSISHQIITEKHGGQIQCWSELGQGATFLIQIPQRQNVAATAQ